MLLAPRAFAPAGSHPAPHAVFARLEGPEFRVADELGHVLFLDFYASWCEPCKIELPLVQAWRRGHPEAVVVPVDVGEPRSVAAEFAARYSLGNVALDPSARSRALFDVEGFPTIVAIDGSGHVRAKWEGLNPAIGLALSNAQSRL
jgi:thiol-disulfide isomerase/thioredoxin